MKIGTCVSFSSMEEMPGKLSVLRKNGFDSCQLIAWEPSLWTDENATALKKLLQDYEITVSAFWCGIQNLCDGADFALKLGITDVATHMGFIPENPCDPNFGGFCIAVRTVAMHLKQNSQYLLFETGQETPVTMLRCFEKIGCDNLGINLDTANLILYGKANPTDALDVFGKYVRNIHAKDGRYPTNGHELGIETKIGEGRVNFKTFFSRLHELGYDSYVTIEREIDGDRQLQDILEAREYLTKIISEIYGGNHLC